MKAIFLLYYAIALFVPPVLFTVILNNYNEDHPLAVYALCIVLSAAAGFLSCYGNSRSKLWWIGWSTVIGIAEASMLYFGA